MAKALLKKTDDKGFTVVVCDRGDYIKEAEKQLGDKDNHEEIPDPL